MTTAGAPDAPAAGSGSLAARVHAQLRAAGDPERAASERAYLKSDRAFLGVGVPRTRKIARAALREHDPDRAGLVAAVGDLWGTGVHDCRMAAVELLAARTGALEARDARGTVEPLVREAGTWALVDPLAITVAAPLVAREDLSGVLDAWASDGDFWVRRTALLALLPALRRGDGDFERFGRYADAMLGEREFFVRKAIGWVLRETGKVSPALVTAWLRPRVQQAAGLTVREAVKYLPEADRDELLTAYREGGRATSRR